MLSRIVRFIILRLVQLFYPHIEVRGEEQLPDGPRLFVLNHPNGLLDPLVLMLALEQQVSFLAKSTFFANPIGRVLMRAFGALPVYRQRDIGKPGGPPAGAVDANEATFAGCRALLRAGQPIALFPEGTTHSNTIMLPLRTGAARIALSAEAEANWQLKLQIIPVGLWYQKKAQFRSAVLVVFGQPFGLGEYRSRYERDDHMAVDVLTEEIDARLDTVVLQAENAELLTGIPLVAAWTAAYELETLEERHARATELLAAYQRLRVSDPARLEEIAREARHYARVLRTLGIDDPWDLELSAARRGRLVSLVLWLIVGFVPALAGIVLSYIPYRLAAPLTPVLLGDHEETTSTGKLIIGSALVALTWLVEAIVCGVIFGAIWGFALLALAPLLSYVALRWGESWRELREAAGYAWLTARHQQMVAELVARRRALTERVAEAVRISDLTAAEPLER
ncbi:MAG TPA: lysophospholipid acyltransferase family protein [Roseiflexaceae bacterium]|nr:lysophospholipid acyltransferase family protein [Roseiflexaceae bacterium]